MFYITSLDEFCRSNAIDDAKRNEGLKTPEGVTRVDNIRYGDDRERNILDVYRPKEFSGKLPVIVSIHGGGWVYGNKEIMQFYCMSLAEKGFAVINFSYRLAPKYKHPVPLEDANKIFYWVFENADKYGFDVNNIFALGDSVGANILGLYCCLCTDAEYSAKMGITPPAGFAPKAVALNSGLYRLVRGEELLLDSLAEAYFPDGGTDKEYAQIALADFVTADFPPCFVMTALGDFLKCQAKPFYEHILSLGIKAEYHCYGNAENELKHVFHIDIKLPEARDCNQDECDFFLNQIKNH
ncbi:MAG: alpha/beta hydrolase [Clostridia bacterium]|nr:alpha/beta hydrolase [Clostridia bacterium]